MSQSSMPVWDTPRKPPDESEKEKIRKEAEAFWNEIKEPKHGEYLLGTEVKKYMFVPTGYLEGAQSKVKDSILMHWNLKSPNLIMTINNSLNAPSSFVDMADADELKADVEAARTCESVDDKVAEIVNRNYQRRLESMMGSVAAAAEMTGSWLYSTAPTTSSYLMDTAMDKLSTHPVWIENSDCGISDVSMAAGAGLTWARVLLQGAVPLHKPASQIFNLNDLEASEKSWCKGFVGKSECIYGKWASWGATHLIFSRTQGALNPKQFGPVGRLVVNGGGVSKADLMEGIRAHQPATIFKHSGRVAHSFSLLIEDMLKHRRQKVATTPPFSDWAQRSGLELPIVQECWDLMQADPEGTLFTETVVIANPQIHTSDEVLSKLATSFASVYKGVHELGAGEADQTTVIFSWRQHKLLRENMARQRKLATMLGNIAIALTFMSTALAVAVVIVNHAWDRDHSCNAGGKKHMYPWLRDFRGSTHWKYVDWLMIVIPALASLIISLLSLKDYRRKAQDLEKSAAQVLSELYMFRMRVGRYSLVSTGADNASMVQHRARKLFSDVLRSILRTASARVGNDHLEANPDGESGNWLPEYMRSQFPTLQNSCLRPSREKKLLPQAVEDQSTYSQLGDAQPLVVQVDDPVDWPPTQGIGSMSVETYMQERTLPLLRDLQAQAPSLSRWFTFYKIMCFLATTTASALAAFKMTSLIPLAVAAGQMANEFLQTGDIESRLVSTNEAVAELNACLIFWESAGIVERGMPQAREYIVSSTEQTILRVLGTSMKTSIKSSTI